AAHRDHRPRAHEAGSGVREPHALGRRGACHGRARRMTTARARRIVSLCAVLVVALPCAASAQMWSLAYPPLAAGSTTPDQSAALPEWTLWQIFPTESACEEHRALWQMVVKAEDEESIRTAGRRAVFAQGI